MRERQSGEWGDGVTAKSKMFWQNLRMTKIKDDRKLSRECEKEEEKNDEGTRMTSRTEA